MTEDATLWLSAPVELNNRKLDDILIACCIGGLNGFQESIQVDAIEIAYAKTKLEDFLVQPTTILIPLTRSLIQAKKSPTDVRLLLGKHHSF
jgi:hypothetical protein